MNENLTWYRVLDDKNQLAEGRVMTVSAGNKELCLTHHQGQYTALENKCPHQGGPLGEGSIENGLLRCPWHGWDFCPHGGDSQDFDDGLETFELKIEGNSIFVGLEEEVPHARSISDLMVETMVNWGVNRVFGMVGHSNLGFADALRRQEEAGHLQFIGIRHEGAAAFAASAYGKLTGKPAACFGIAGPGSTNLFTGMWDAKVDRAPLLTLSGQVATQVVGTGNFQEVDLVRAFSTVAEFNHRVEEKSRHAELMNLAIKHAILNRDVSHLTFPDDIQTIPVGEHKKAGTPDLRITRTDISPPEESLQEAFALLNEAQRPVIIVGHGARFHKEAVIELAEELQCAVLTTFKGKGLIPDDHPLACGVLGRSGTPVASYFMNESDVLLVIGASFSNHTGITPKKKLIQIDFDPLALSKFHQVHAALWGEISRTLSLMKGNIQLANKENQAPQIQERWSIWRSEKQRRLLEETGHGISSIAVFDALNETAPQDAVMCVDVGNNAYSFGRYYESKANNSFLMSGYLGSIGFALPAAIGTWAAVGNTRPIIAVAGDGGLCQYLAEITTLVRYKIPAKIIVLNNNELGKISKEQRAGEFDVWATDLVNPDFASYARSCGAFGIQVFKDEDLKPRMRDLFEYDGPGLVEIRTDVRLL